MVKLSTKKISQLTEAGQIAYAFGYLYDFEKKLTASFKKGTLKPFLKILSVEQLLDALLIAYSKFPNAEDAEIMTKYFCGICWNWIKKSKNVEGKET